jgi:hypothetical protein
MEKKKVYQRKWFAVLFLFLFAPVGIILLYKYGHFSKITKVVLSVIFGLIFIIAVIPTDTEETASDKNKGEEKAVEVAAQKDDTVSKEDEAKKKAEAEAAAKKKAEEEALAKKQAEDEAKKLAAAEAKKKAEQETPEYKLNKGISKVLGKESNREGKRISALSIDDSGNIVVNFKGDENLTENLTVTGIKMDVSDVLKAIKKSKVALNSVNVITTYSMVDQYGNAEESEVVNVTYSKATIDKINFENFSYKNIYTIADSVSFIHPQFLGKE